MDWEHINPALIDLFSAIAVNPIPGAKPFEAQWDGGPRLHTSDKYRCDVFLNVTSVVGIGPDERRTETIVDGLGRPIYNRVTVCGPRRVVLRVSATSIDDTDTASASHVIERIRSRLEFPSSIAALQAVQLSVAKIGPAMDTGFRDGARLVPRCTMDLTLIGVINEIDPTQYPFIERIAVKGRVSGVAEPETLEPSGELPLTDNAQAWLYDAAGALLTAG